MRARNTPGAADVRRLPARGVLAPELSPTPLQTSTGTEKTKEEGLTGDVSSSLAIRLRGSFRGAGRGQVERV